MTDAAATTRRFVDLVTTRCVPAIRALEMFETAGLEPAEPDVAAEFLREGEGQAYVTAASDVLIYQPADVGFCGVISDPVVRLRAVNALQEWAASATPPFRISPVDEEDIQVAWLAPHDQGGETQVLLSFETPGDSAVHASAAWVKENA